MSTPSYRTLAIDYTGGPLGDDDFEDLHDAIVDLFATHDCKVEGTSDGPTIA